MHAFSDRQPQETEASLHLAFQRRACACGSTMLRGQYGTATPSSFAPVTHAEDAQPNEGINKRTAYLPPPIRSTSRSDATGIHYRGGFRGRGAYRGTNTNHREHGRPLIQYAIRANPDWRGRGRGFRVYPDRTPNTADVYSSSSSTSSSSTNPTPKENISEAYAARRRTQELRNQSSSQTFATPPLPQKAESSSWMLRSRSPTPKLPPTPLTRRKFDEDPPLPPSQPSPLNSSSTPAKLPLPGRMHKATEPVKKEIKSPAIKREILSPPPLRSPPKPERKLIMSACKFFPFPDNCRKSHPNYEKNRRTYVLSKNRELIGMGLKREKAFVRDDGLVIEWSSAVPVWSDTLLPETMDLASAIRQTYQTNRPKPSHDRAASGSSQKSECSAGPSASQSKISQRPIPKSINADSSLPTTSVHLSPKKNMKRSSEGCPSLPSKKPRRSPTPNMITTKVPSLITPSPPAKIMPESKTRLPLPGRPSMDSKPPPVPIAFLPRPTTPKSMSKSTLMNLKKHSHATGRKLSFSDCSSQRTTTVSPRPSPPPTNKDYSDNTNFSHIYPPLNFIYPTSTMDENNTTIYPMWHPPVTPQLPEKSFEYKDMNLALTDDDPRMIDSDYLDAEDVATSLLTRPYDNFRSDDEVDVNTSGSADADASGEVEALVSEYLLRYCQLFDSDRSKLEMAYDQNALFSCRVHHQEEPSFSMAGLFAPEVEHSFRSTHSRATASSVYQGRTNIINKLLSLGPYQFCPRGVTSQLLYDTVDAGSASAGVLLTVHGEVVNPHISNPDLDHVLTLDQSFVLRHTSTMITDVQDEGFPSDVNNGLRQNTSCVWPLVAVSHQMTVRAAPFLSAERLEEALPWIREVF